MSDAKNELALSRLCTPAFYKSALRKVPAAVAVILTEYEGQIRGMTATAICSVSAEPPMMLVCVHQGARTRRLISAAGRFSVNFLSDEQKDLAERFSQPELSERDRLEGVRWVFEGGGAPTLDDALASFSCDIVHEAAHGTHHVFIAAVNDIKSGHAEPLLYLDGSYRYIAGLSEGMIAR
jgi:flavin reductase